MIKLESQATQFLVNRLSGSRSMVELNDELKIITIRLEAPTLKAIEEMTAKTGGWSRNLVVNFLLMGGLELVGQQLRQEKEEQGQFYWEIK